VPRRRLIAVHHRLGGRTGHRFHEALGLVEQAPGRGFEPLIFISAWAEPAVRDALAAARPVLHDPVFRTDLTFDERTRDFVVMLHEHVDAEVRRDDVVLMTVATQCETRAFAAWLAELPAEKKPFVVFLFHSDRWNRYGEAERARQGAEFAVLAAELARLSRADRERLVFGATTPPLAREISGLLGIPVSTAPLTLVYDEKLRAGARERPAGPPRVGFLGGARPEKGTHLARRIVEECRKRTHVRFLVQLANEQLPPEAWGDLQGLAAEPDVEVLHGSLSLEDYGAAVASCDILPFPYDRLAYRQRSSGVFAEAVTAGKVVVVPADLWLGTLVARGEAAGVTYDGDDTAGCAAAVAECVRRLPELRARARTLAASWAARQSLAAFLDWTAAELRSRSRPPAGRTLRAAVSRLLHSFAGE
jgi:hypothetical protein